MEQFSWFGGGSSHVHLAARRAAGHGAVVAGDPDSAAARAHPHQVRPQRLEPGDDPFSPPTSPQDDEPCSKRGRVEPQGNPVEHFFIDDDSDDDDNDDNSDDDNDFS